MWFMLERSYVQTLSKDVQTFWVPLLLTGVASITFDCATGWWSAMWAEGGLEAVWQLVYQWAHWMDGVAIVAQCRLLARERSTDWFVLAFVVQMFLARATL